MMKVLNIAIFHVNVSRNKLFIMNKKRYRDSHLKKPDFYDFFVELVFPELTDLRFVLFSSAFVER